MPYTPTVQDRTGEFLMRGITGAADAVAQGIQTYRKNKEESSGFDTYLESVARQYASDPKFVDTFGDQLAKAPGMSLSQKKSLAGSLALYEQRGRQQQEMALKQADAGRAERYLKLQEDQFGQAQKQREAQGRFGQLLARYAAQPADLGTQFSTGTAGLEQPGGLNVESYLQAAGEAGVMPDPRVLDQFITQSQRGGPSGLTYEEDPVTGARHVRFGNNLLPTGINPARQQAQAVDITDEEGNVIGKGLPGRNGLQLIRQPATSLAPKDRVKLLLQIADDVLQPEERRAAARRQADELLAAQKSGAAPATPAPAASAFETELNALLNRSR